MKRLTAILIGVLFAGALGLVQAQAPFAKYKTTVTTGDTYHTLSASALILWEPTANDTLNRRLLLGGSEQILVKNGSKYRPTMASGIPCIFGSKKFSTIGILADGFVFFGSKLDEGDQTDSIRPFINVDNFYGMTEAKDYIYSSFLTNEVYGAKGAVLLGGENAKIGWERDGDVLYIAYENIRVKTSDQNVATLSWYYAINLATGEIILHTKDFNLSGTTAFQYSFGLVSSVDFSNTDALWLSSWGGATDHQAYRTMTLSSASNPKDSVYHFNLPAACEKIADFSMTWDQDNSSVEGSRINIGMPSWNEGEKALFILSEQETLADGNLPQDGVLYNDNSKIGTSAGVRVGTQSNGFCSVSGVFDGLKPSTTYYVHAFGYNDSCSGILYSDVQKTSYTTLMGTPRLEDISLGAPGMNSIQVVLPALASGTTYVIGVSETSLVDYTEEAYGNILKNGQTYTVGQKLADDLGEYEVTISKVGVSAGTHTIDGLKQGTDYHIAVWYMTGSGETSAYSFRPALVSTKTVMQVPVTIDFENEELASRPIGWRISKDGENYGFEVRNYGTSEDGGIDDGGIALTMAKAPRQGSRLLVSQLNYLPEDYDAAPQTKDTSAYAITPVFQKAENPNLQAIFNVGFYTKESDMASETAYRLQDGDSAVISWAANQNATAWTKLAKLDKSTKFDNSGFITLTTPSIAPASTFCYKVEYFFRADKDATAGVMFAIQSIEIEEDLPCKYPVNMAAPEDSLGATSALLTWEDGNAGVSDFAKSFIISYQEQGQTDWVPVRPNPTDEQCRLENLRPGMDYTVRMQAVCGSQNGNSLVKTMEFRTLDVIPYTVDILNGDDVTELVNANGALNTEPEPIDEGGWLYASDCAGYPIMNLQLAVNRNAWLKLPTLVSSYDTKVKVSTSVFNYKNQFNSWERPEVKDDTLWVFVSETGKFAPASDRKTVGFIVLDSLDCELEEDEENMAFIPKYNEKVFEFDAQAGKKYTVAYYIRSIHAGAADNEEDMNVNNLAIGKIRLTYGDVEYPAVTDLHTENLAKTSVSVVWTGNADSYVVKYKPRRAENFDSVEVTASRAGLTDLLPGTSYEYLVYGIYGGVHGAKSETQYFNTIAICEAPTDFAVVDTFWDGARIVARSKNPRLIHIEALGDEIGEFWVNTVMSWTGTRDSVRLRGLHVLGVGFPFGVRVRSVCSSGDSSEWTPRLVFHTADYPEIGVPTNLKAQYNSATRTAVLSWTPGVNNDYNYIYYRKGSGKYDTAVTRTSTYTLVGLETDVVYKWRLQPLYDTYLLGDMTSEQEFSTAVGNERNEYAQALRIRVNNRQIVVENPDSRYIKLIRVYDLKGRVLKTYPVNDTESVFVNTDLDQGMVIVEVIGSAGERASLKAVIM